MSTDTVESARQSAQQAAQEATGQAQAKLRQQLEQRTIQAAEQVNRHAADLRSVGDALRDEGKDGPAKAAERLAAYAGRVGSYLQDRDPDTLLRDAEDFGRDRPWAVAAGGLALGFAASRFLKASSRERYRSSGGQSTYRQSPEPRPTPPSPAPPVPSAQAGQTPVSPGRSTPPPGPPPPLADRPVPPRREAAAPPPRRSGVRPSSLSQSPEPGV